MGLASTLNKMGKSKSFEEEFLEKLDVFYKRVGVNRPGSKSYKPSKIFGCKRNLYYMRTGETPDGPGSVNPGMTRINRAGSADHLVVQSDLWDPIVKELGIEMVDPVEVVERAKEMGLENVITKRPDANNPYEVRVLNTTYDLSFMFDGVLRFLEKKVIFEFKTEEYFNFTKRTSPKHDHILQAACYSLCLGIKWVLFLYQDRNYKSFKAYLVEITEDMRQDVLVIISEVNSYVETRTLPPAETKKCKYCVYKTACARDGK